MAFQKAGANPVVNRLYQISTDPLLVPMIYTILFVALSTLLYQLILEEKAEQSAGKRSKRGPKKSKAATITKIPPEPIEDVDSSVEKRSGSKASLAEKTEKDQQKDSAGPAKIRRMKRASSSLPESDDNDLVLLNALSTAKAATAASKIKRQVSFVQKQQPQDKLLRKFSGKEHSRKRGDSAIGLSTHTSEKKPNISDSAPKSGTEGEIEDVSINAIAVAAEQEVIQSNADPTDNESSSLDPISRATSSQSLISLADLRNISSTASLSALSACSNTNCNTSLSQQSSNCTSSNEIPASQTTRQQHQPTSSTANSGTETVQALNQTIKVLMSSLSSAKKAAKAESARTRGITSQIGLLQQAVQQSRIREKVLLEAFSMLQHARDLEHVSGEDLVDGYYWGEEEEEEYLYEDCVAAKGESLKGSATQPAGDLAGVDSGIGLSQLKA